MMTAWILESALRSLLMAAVVWAGIKLLRVRNVAVQKAAWVLVLMAAIVMPGLAGWKVPQQHAAVVVPVQKFTPAVSFPDLGTSSKTASVTTATVILSFPETAPVQHRSFNQWKGLIAPVYLAVCGALLLRLIFGLMMALRIVHHAEKASALLEPRAQVRISANIQTPVTIGSTIVLPESHEDWDLRKLRVVLAHERSHVRQGDFYLQLLAGLYAAFFWFSPLSWWLKKELSDLGEAISDCAALDEAPSRANYAEVLVEFAAIRRRPLAGVAMARSSNIRRRIDRLLVEHKFRNAFTICRWHLAAAAALVPAGLVVAVALVRVDAAQAQIPAIAPAPPVPSARPLVPSLAAAIVHATKPIMAQEKAPQQPVHIREFTDDDDNSYAIVTGDSANVIGSWHSGNGFDKVKGKMHGNYIWFERDSKSYVIDDPALVDRAREYFRPMEDLGRRQGELGEAQGRLGAEQGKLGAMQAKASAPAPDLSKEIAGVQEALQKLQQGRQVEMSQEQLAGIQAKLADLEGRLGDMQGQIGAKQAEFGDQQAKLGEQQAKLGEQQAAIGEQQAAASKVASQKMKSLIDSAMQQGKARPVD